MVFRHPTQGLDGVGDRGEQRILSVAVALVVPGPALTGGIGAQRHRHLRHTGEERLQHLEFLYGESLESVYEYGGAVGETAIAQCRRQTGQLVQFIQSRGGRQSFIGGKDAVQRLGLLRQQTLFAGQFCRHTL